MAKNYKQEINLSNLSRWKEGKNKGNINWTKSIDKIVSFKYDNIEGFLKIIRYNSKNQELIILYNDKEFKIKTTSFINCQIGRMIGKITKEFKYKIGTRFQDNKRDITITNTEYRKDKNGIDRKWYKYKCNVCGWTEGWIIEGHIDEGNGCGCCANRVPVLGINTIWDTDHWMIPIINDDEFCKTHTHSCSDSIYPTCPDCGRIKSNKMSINTIYGRHGTPCVCSDNFSYPEKIMFNVLEQVKIKFEYHKTFEWSKNIQVENPKLCGSKEYDFYFEYNNEQYIIETHGSQHYEKNKFSTMKGAKTLEEEQLNDKIKKELALSNSIKEENYIVVDCRNTYMKWIKEHIIESNLKKLFDLNNINWNTCLEFTSSNLVKVACEYKRNNDELFSGDISKIMNINQYTVIRYLKIGNKLTWCNYDAVEEKIRNNKRATLFHGKKIKCIELNKNFNSLRECSRYFKENLEIQLFGNCIGMVCNNKLESYKGYHFYFINEEECAELSQAI